MVVLLGGRVTEHIVFGADHHRRLRRPAQGRTRSAARWSPTTAWAPSCTSQAAPRRRLLDVRPHAPHASTRSSSTSPTWRTARRHDAGRRAPHAARGVRLHAARERGARARGHRAHHGRVQRPGAPSRRPRPPAEPSGREPRVAPRALEAAGHRRPRTRLAAIPPRPCSGGSTTSESRSSDLDDAIGPLRERLGMPVAAPRDGRGAGRRGRAARRRREPRGAAAAARAGHGGRPSSSSAAAPGCTTWRTRPTTSRRRSKPVRAAGLRLIDEQPRTGIRGSRVAFLHPKSTGGVLTELVEPAEGH